MGLSIYSPEPNYCAKCGGRLVAETAGWFPMPGWRCTGCDAWINCRDEYGNVSGHYGRIERRP